MFGLLTRIPARPVPIIPKMKSGISTELRDEYITLSKKHSLSGEYSISLEKTTMEIVDFLTENGVELYDYDHVVNYMTAVAHKSKKELVWRALRDNHLKGVASLDYYKGVDVYGIYSRPVPIEVLRNVDLLTDKFGSENIVFAITDFQVPNPDPFIRVSCVGSLNYIVFGMWDEPGYTLGHTQAASALKQITK